MHFCTADIIGTLRPSLLYNAVELTVKGIQMGNEPYRALGDRHLEGLNHYIF